MNQNKPIASEGVLIFNDQGNIVLVNPSVNQIFGYGGNELLGMPIVKLIQEVPPITRQPTPASKDATLSTAKRTTGVKKDGTSLSVEISFCPFEGVNEFFLVAFVSESAHQSNIGEMMINKNLTPVIFLILDRSANISLINNYGSQLLGRSETELRGLNWFQNFLSNSTQPRLQAIFEEVWDTGVVETYESPLLTLSGELHSFFWTTSVICDSTGEQVGTLSTGVNSGKMTSEIDRDHIEKIMRLDQEQGVKLRSQTRDLVLSLAKVEKINLDLQLQISKRKAIEQELIKFQRLYDTMVHNFPDGVIGVLNREMKYVLIDGKDLNEIDLPSLGLTGLKVSETQDPAIAELTISNIKKAFNGHSVSFEVKTKDRFYNIAAVPLPDAKNEINEILCVLKNVTDRKRMEDGLLKALEKERELGELKSRFVTMASHEFKTPLATILSSTFLLENYSGADYDKEKMVHTNRIKRSVRNLTMILNEFLSLGKLEENQVRVANTELEIQKYIQELITEIESVKQAGQIICYEHSGDQDTVCLDPILLWSIVTNLISNALKYSKPGDCIYLNSEVRNNVITIKVKDFGIGIPFDEHKHIFGRFYRARNAMNFEGTGLGLHIVEKNVKLFGGAVSFTSQPNDGTEFTVTLPNGSSEPIPVYN